MDNIYTIVVILMSIIIYMIQLGTINHELHSGYFFRRRRVGDWNLHYDEKITLTDARYLYLKYALKQEDLKKFDFLPPPISACFGVMPTLLVYLGFRIFGYNNLGLRFFHLLTSALFNMFVAMTILEILPGLLGLTICSIYLINWHLFVLTRHAIIEHALTLYLTVIYYLLIAHTNFFISNIFIIYFFSASIILFKINFPLYILILLLSIGLSFFDITLLLKTMTAFAMGILFFEILQCLLLQRFGILRWRYITLFDAFRIHGGKKHGVGIRLRSLGSSTVFIMINLIMQWFGLKGDLIKIKGDMMSYNLMFFGTLVFLIFISYQYNPLLTVLLIFLTFCIASFVPFFFYLKRLTPIIPLCYVLIAYGVYVLVHEIPKIEVIFLPLLVFICALNIYKHIADAIFGFKRKTNNLYEIAHQIDKLIPDRAEIYCHGIAYRNLWQITKHRLFSSDDDLMKNKHIIDWAIKQRARYVIITTGGEFLSKKYRWNILKIIKVFESCQSDTEVPEEFILCEIDI